MHTIEEQSHEANPRPRGRTYYLKVDLSDPETAETVYGEVFPESPRPRSWRTAWEYCRSAPQGYYEEVSLDQVVPLSPAQFARARALGWPDLMEAIREIVHHHRTWLEDHDLGAIWESLDCEDAFIRSLLQEEIQRQLGD